MCLILNAHGYRAIGSQDAAEAQQKFREHPIDMVIVDHGLPGISGGDLAALLKRERNVLVLMLTGNPELTGKPDAVDLLLPKPQAIPELLAAIEQLFAN